MRTGGPEGQFGNSTAEGRYPNEKFGKSQKHPAEKNNRHAKNKKKKEKERAFAKRSKLTNKKTGEGKIKRRKFGDLTCPGDIV